MNTTLSTQHLLNNQLRSLFSSELRLEPIRQSPYRDPSGLVDHVFLFEHNDKKISHQILCVDIGVDKFNQVVSEHHLSWDIFEH
jgi:hypothetical protein